MRAALPAPLYRVFITLACGIGWMVLVASPAFAHATTVTATPAVQTTSARPVSEIEITFTETLEPSRSGIRLIATDGHVVATGKAHGSSLVIKLGREIRSGVFHVGYKATGLDGHETDGSYSFAVWLPGTPAPPGIATLGIATQTNGSLVPTIGRDIALATSLALAGLLVAIVLIGVGETRTRARRWSVALIFGALAGDAIAIAGSGASTAFAHIMGVHAIALIALAISIRSSQARDGAHATP
ncbi:MAG: hypothetical protein NVSMB57_15560 [Actinomycetota bacterium]